MERLSTARQVCRRAGITYRQLDYWIRTGRIEADRARPGSGVYRTFTEAEALAICDLARHTHRVEAELHQIGDGSYYRAALRRHRAVTRGAVGEPPGA